MRTLLKVIFQVEAANKAVADGSLQKIIMSTIEKIKPEATYFLASEGCRSGIFVFDLKDASDLPGIVEPFFRALNAKIECCPVMNAEDLQKGLSAISK
ncbi:hypothetical protein ACDQ55_06470 [Chitinophaga sp. 30R24]|uniref:hypothetical protein n=1 Tax=Chitinophaga sp. 30R24 TaxID=3248838 RepID=UPI003B900FF7